MFSHITPNSESLWSHSRKRLQNVGSWAVFNPHMRMCIKLHRPVVLLMVAMWSSKNNVGHSIENEKPVYLRTQQDTSSE